MSRISVVIPAYNEASDLPQTIQGIRDLSLDCEVIVVDDGSADDTKKIAERLADITVALPVNQGKGQALMEGWKRAEGTHIVMLDADLGSTSSEMAHLLPPLLTNEADLVIGMLPTHSSKKGFGLVKKRAQQYIAKRTGAFLTAPLSGQRAFHRRWLPSLLEENVQGFGVETQMLLHFLLRGAVVKEIPTLMAHRYTGKTISGFIHRFLQWIDIERALRGSNT